MAMFGSHMLSREKVVTVCYKLSSLKLSFFARTCHHLVDWLVAWNFFFHILGMSSSQLPTDEVIFFRGVGIPTTNQVVSTRGRCLGWENGLVQQSPGGKLTKRERPFQREMLVLGSRTQKMISCVW